MHSVNFQFKPENKSISDLDSLMTGLNENPYFQEMCQESMNCGMKGHGNTGFHSNEGMFTSKGQDTHILKPYGMSLDCVSTGHELSCQVPVQVNHRLGFTHSNSIDTQSHEAVVAKKPDTTYKEPTKLRVSTMTAICSSDFTVDLELFYTHIEFESINPDKPYIQSCQYGSRPIKGIDVKVKKKRSKPKKKKDCFQNQATVIVNLANGNRVNLKIFRNGKLQMTGLKSQEGGNIACQTLITKLQEMAVTNPDVVTFHSETPVPNNFNIVLINSDFSVGFKIKRDELYHILFNQDIFVSYEPDIYPGVNAKYYYNSFNNYSGICNCSLPCDGKGDGNGDGRCKKVTIATFQSGNIIITGARNNEQTEAAYNFINNLFRTHFHEIVRVTNQDNMVDVHTNHKKVTINISNIINYSQRSIILKTLKKK